MRKMGLKVFVKQCRKKYSNADEAVQAEYADRAVSSLRELTKSQ